MSVPLTWDVETLIERQAVEVHFQPIVSIRRQTIVGLEALSRGVASDGQLIPPALLFSRAAEQGLSLELDRLCRRKAVECFAPLTQANPELVLFVNVLAVSVLADDALAELEALARGFGVRPPNIAIEILETAINDAPALRETVARYKAHGFLVVLDDVGAGHSNLDRIAYVKPDILKVDRTLVRDIQRDYHKQEVLRSLVHLSERIGGWVIVEGVEAQEEVVASLGLRADMFQGFLFARPYAIERNGALRYETGPMQETAATFKRQTVQKIQTLRDQFLERQQLARTVAQALAAADPSCFDTTLLALVGPDPRIESACVLDAAGIQVSDTVHHPQGTQPQKSLFFEPPAPGTDHSFKEYFYVLADAGVDPFETNPYVPLPTGHLCVTVSTLFHHAGQPFILVLHLPVDHATLDAP